MASRDKNETHSLDLNDKIHRSHLQALMGRTVSGANPTTEETHYKQVRQSSSAIPALPRRRKGQITPIKHTREMEFLHEKKDYNVAEFYEHFHNDLPKTAMVNQGFCGEIVEDTFDREQVLRVHAISKQKRVIAKFQYGTHTRMISIPVTYEEKLCIVKHFGKRDSKLKLPNLVTDGKPKPLYNILKDNTMPLTVQFPKDHEITVGNQIVNTNNIPCMELVQTFDEVYLLSNFITDGVMSQDVVHVPLYLSQLRLALITGIKGQAKEKWNSYQQELDRAAQYIEFDQEFGNPNIAEYDSSAIHSDTTYSYVEPTAYSNIASFAHKSPISSFENTTYNPDPHQKEGTDAPDNVPAQEDAQYEEIENTAREKPPVKGKQDKHNKAKKPLTNPGFVKELETTLKAEDHHGATPKLTAFKTQPQKHDAPPPLAPKPNSVHRIAKQDDGFSPALPARTKPTHGSEKPVPVPTAAYALYSNDIPRTRISPTMHVNKEVELKPVPKEVVEKPIPEVNTHDDITKLSIDEVSEYLKVLNLERYSESFKSEQIDGPMLAELDKDMLREDFGMKGVEALRLIKFAKEGHVPT